jgi:hypothetical protein
MRSRRLASPRPVRVAADGDGVPTAVGGRPVRSVLEEWLVEDRWWTGRPLRRHYFEVVLDEGRNAVVFRDLQGDRWLSQRC